MYNTNQILFIRVSCHKNLDVYTKAHYTLKNALIIHSVIIQYGVGNQLRACVFTQAKALLVMQKHYCYVN